MKKLLQLLKTLIKYEKKAEEITGKDLDALIAERVKRELEQP